uniref:Uncharacterized protein n=1 Tax=Schistosoma haematobium TaxID=6185 RepID=A0A095BUQ3_SCHHA
MNFNYFNTVLIFLANFTVFVFGAFRNEHYNQASFRTKREIHATELARLLAEVPSGRQDDVALKIFQNIINKMIREKLRAESARKAKKSSVKRVKKPRLTPVRSEL